MGAMKRFCEEAAEAGRCPLTRETFDYLDDVECRHQLDWIGYCEHDYAGHDGRRHWQDCITMESARRLVAVGLANDEIAGFVECFAGFCRERQCWRCGVKAKPAYFVPNEAGENLCVWCE
jgi:hypothetical protein